MIRHRVHQKTRRLDNLRSRLARVEADAAAGLVRLCFGGRKLWRGQYNLEANGYGSHAEWPVGRLAGCPQRRVLPAGQPGRDRRLPAVRGRGLPATAP